MAATLQRALSPAVQAGGPVGLSWGIDVDGERRTGALGHLDAGRQVPAAADTIYRISSLSKPVTAAAALVLVEHGALSLDQPIHDLLPELTDPPVLLRPDGALEETEPARRNATVEDLLTLRLGHGTDFTALGTPNPLEDRLGELGLGMGPPAPSHHLPPDEWVSRLGTVPFRHQPGDRWLYNTGAELLGVLLARVCGRSLEAVLRERVLIPLGMSDTAFTVPPHSLDRLGPLFSDAGTETAQAGVYDPTDGQWSRAAAFQGGDGGLVSTVGDFLSFAVMLRDGGTSAGTRVLARETVHAMTANHLTRDQLRAGGPSPDGRTGWGYGVGVSLAGPSDAVVGSYGWDGGLGSTWRNDEARGLSAVLLTNQMWSSPTPPPVADNFWSVLAEQLPRRDG